MTKSTKSSNNPKSNTIRSFLARQSCLTHLVLIGLFLLLCLMLAFGWLKIYTNHGQKLVLPDYTQKPLAESQKDAKAKSFEIVVTDSIHDLDYGGGIIVSQNPLPQSLVKEKRKIYVTVTKFNPDLIPLDELPRLYGNIFTSMKPLIEGRQLKTNILDYRYDSGPPNSILEVSYRGETIVNKEGKKPRFSLEKGGTLDFILAKSSGGTVKVPKLVCREYTEAVFIANSHRLSLQVEDDREFPIEDLPGNYVYKQIPPFEGGAAPLMMNDTIRIFLTPEKPSDCADGFVPEEQF